MHPLQQAGTQTWCTAASSGPHLLKHVEPHNHQTPLKALAMKRQRTLTLTLQSCTRRSLRQYLHSQTSQDS